MRTGDVQPAAGGVRPGAGVPLPDEDCQEPLLRADEELDDWLKAYFVKEEDVVGGKEISS